MLGFCSNAVIFPRLIRGGKDSDSLPCGGATLVPGVP